MLHKTLKNNNFHDHIRAPRNPSPTADASLPTPVN